MNLSKLRKRSAFTLVEMLVAVALVLLMMSMFTEVFSLATSTMARQKGLSENDQRARMVVTILGSDLRKRSFREVTPFVPGMSTEALDSMNEDSKMGYFAFSENIPEDDTDDVLRLTIDTTKTEQDLGTEEAFLLFGKAVVYLPTGGSLSDHPNQPEGDDGNVTGLNNSGQSTAAEVVWFLRNGNLYRRMLLVRKPYQNFPSDDPTTGQPPTTTPLFGTGYTGFWNDFDYSAFYNTGLNHLQFSGVNSLKNISSTALRTDVGSGISVPISLGVPSLRFGYSITANTLAPREYDSSNVFFGCFTHEETSNTQFRYPGLAVVANANDPFNTATTVQLDTASNAITQYAGGPRVGEDLLLSNVVSFDIKVWDPGVGVGPDGAAGFANIDDDGDGPLDTADPDEVGAAAWSHATLQGAASDDGSWVDLGHSTNTGLFFRRASTMNGTNTASAGNRFDTWHPDANLTDPPPYLSVRCLPQGDALATGLPTSRTVSVWTSGTNYTAGNLVMPPSARQQGYRFIYRCQTDGTAGAGEPLWQQTAFAPTVEPGGPTWEAIPNSIPLRAMQIKIRYLDVSSGLLKDLTYVASLSDSL